MKTTMSLLFSLFLFIAYSTAFAFAVPPVIQHNVLIIHDASPNQCPSSMQGDMTAEVDNVASAFGGDDELTSPGVQSCTGCAIDQQSGNCVCSTCYKHFDN